MWVATTQGFYSVVAHRDEPDKLLVRARTREDIETLREQIPALAQLVTDLDYDNFKNAVAERQGAERAALYGVVWRELLRLQRAAAT